MRAAGFYRVSVHSERDCLMQCWRSWCTTPNCAVVYESQAMRPSKEDAHRETVGRMMKHLRERTRAGAA